MRHVNYLIVFSTLFFNGIFSKSAITYVTSGGRFGDQLIHYCIAKQLAIKYGIEFYYRRFDYSDRLVLSIKDSLFVEASFKNHKRIDMGYEFETPPCLEKDFLYVVTPEHWKFSAADITWYGIHQTMIDEFKTLIQPLFEIKKFKFPDNMISVALHVRVGDGFDYGIQEDWTIIKPGCKFPKDEFFIDSIKKIQNHFNNPHLYIYVFTDAFDKQSVVDRLQHTLNDPSVCFAPLEKNYSEQPWNEDVLEDLFFMAQFDCLVRPHSNYSFIAQLIGNHKYIALPGDEIING
jgi:hypothetical protein